MTHKTAESIVFNFRAHRTLALAGFCLLFCSGCSGCNKNQETKPPHSNTEAEERQVENNANPAAEGGLESPKRNPPASEQNQESNKRSDTTGEPASTTSEAQQGVGSTKQAVNAYESARGLWSRAKSSANQGKHADAFIQARDAWRMLDQFPEDARCVTLANEIANDLENWGRKANEQNAAELGDRPVLIVK